MIYCHSKDLSYVKEGVAMIYVKTDEEKLNNAVKALASRYADDSSPNLAVCAESEPVPSDASRLIVIYSDDSFTSGTLHSKYLTEFGDNYVPLSRPVSVRMLDEALRRLLRIQSSAPSAAIPIVYDKKTRTITKNGKCITLTEKEAQLYTVLREAEGKPVSREELRRRLWPDTDGTNAPDVYVSYLRHKLNSVMGEGTLVSVRGLGYLLKEE